ncbi:MAG: Ig-like domain-containing protein [Gemmatimonadaceae bacterium]|nr:Ig-like domain-containing protein [Gemmatimonadaceae bacterium]
MRSSNQLQVHRAENARHPVAIAIFLLCVGLALNCSTDAVVPSEPPGAPIVQEARTISKLHLSPAADTLFTIGTPGTLDLVLEALDQVGQRMDVSRSVTFASSVPAVATVDERGVVTAVAPGIAKITATVTTGLITRSASMAVSVVEPPVLHLSGTYDFKALVSCCLGGIHGFTGVFTFPGPRVTVGLIGTYTDWQPRTPAGEAFGPPLSGTIWLEFWDGRPLLVLVSSIYPGHILLEMETIAESSTSDTSSPSLQGTWWSEPGWDVGTYTATRRVQ